MGEVVTNEFVVGCTPEDAFEYLSDMRNELEWNADECQSVEKLTDGPIGMGTKFRTKWKWSPRTEVEYVSFEAPHTWTAHTDGSLETNFTCTITPHPDGAKVAVEFELIPHGWFKPIFPLFARSFRKQTQTTAEKIRTTIDARHGHATTP